MACHYSCLPNGHIRVLRPTVQTWPVTAGLATRPLTREEAEADGCALLRQDTPPNERPNAPARADRRAGAGAAGARATGAERSWGVFDAVQADLRRSCPRLRRRGHRHAVRADRGRQHALGGRDDGVSRRPVHPRPPRALRLRHGDGLCRGDRQGGRGLRHLWTRPDPDHDRTGHRGAGADPARRLRRREPYARPGTTSISTKRPWSRQRARTTSAAAAPSKC